jgi:diguanylate cyclase (GGDEF)-like protein
MGIMIKSNFQANKSILNKYKLIYIPLLIGITAIITISFISYYVGRRLLLDQMKQDGISLAKLTAAKIHKEKEAIESINSLMDDKIRVAKRLVMSNQHRLSNDLLKEIAKTTDVDEIYWYNPSGMITFSTKNSYIGWTPFSGHPADKFITSGVDELVERFGKDSPSSNLNKYGYFRNPDGSFVQIGILSYKIEALTHKFSYQRLVEELAAEDNIAYALVLDVTLKAIADSNLEDIGVVYEDNLDLLSVLKGNTIAYKWHYPKTGNDVLEIGTPLFHNDEIIGILAIGLSMDHVHSHIYFILRSTTVVAAIIALLLLWIQNRNMVRPILRLNKNIGMIDIDKNIGYRILTSASDSFHGLSHSINNMLDKIDISFKHIKEQEEYIEYMAYYDSLTGLPNKRLFIDKLKAELANNRRGAVLLLDLDDFKEINDTLGHTFGDKVMKNISDKLMTMRDEDIFISRFGGDEFLILASGGKNICHIENYAKDILNFMKNEMLVEQDDVRISCSIGITTYPEDSNDVNQLIMNADMAMYTAKESGKNNYVFFDDEMLKRLNEKIDIGNILRQALKDKDFKLLYQPQVGTNTGAIEGFEALLRLKNRRISPAQFIPVAEKTGLIIEIGRWVTEEAIKQISQWRSKGLPIKPVSINFSARQLDDSNYISFLEAVLKAHDVESKYIEIEITESLFLEKREKTIEFLGKLKSLGVKIALDDFGTGYSSLSYVAFLPVDKIKLDKSLSDKYLETRNIKVIDAVISLAHSLNLEIVAEGIETMEQYIQLGVGKCNYIQGYIFSPPLEVENAEKLFNYNYLEKLEGFTAGN